MKKHTELITALVPESEQPYPIPENWIWTRFEVCFRDKTSSDKKLPQKQYEESGEYAVIDQGQQLIGGYTNDTSLVFNGILPVIVFGDHTRAVKWIDFDFVQGADGVKVFQPVQNLNAKFLYYWMSVVELPDKGYSRHSKFLRETYVPLPPLPEQQRIAARLESLLGKIKEAKALLDETPEILQNFRQSVLAAACAGRLTEEWRKENRNTTPSNKLLSLILDERRKKWEDTELAKLRDKGNKPKDDKWKKMYKKPAAPEITNLPELPPKWSWSNIQQLAEAQANAIKAGPFGSSLKKIYYVPKGYKIYGQEQVIRDDPYYGNYYIDENRFKELSSCSVKPGDILVSLVGTIGRVLILPQDIEPGIINPRLVKMSLDKRLINPLFINTVVPTLTQ